MPAGARSICLAAISINENDVHRFNFLVIIDLNRKPSITTSTSLLGAFVSRKNTSFPTERLRHSPPNKQDRTKTEIFAVSGHFPSPLPLSVTVTPAAPAVLWSRRSPLLILLVSFWPPTDPPWQIPTVRRWGIYMGKMTSDIMIHNHLIQLNSGVTRHRKNVIHGCWVFLFFCFLFSDTATDCAHSACTTKNKTVFVTEHRSPEASVTEGCLRQVTGIRQEPVAADPGYQWGREALLLLLMRYGGPAQPGNWSWKSRGKLPFMVWSSAFEWLWQCGTDESLLQFLPFVVLTSEKNTENKKIKTTSLLSFRIANFVRAQKTEDYLWSEPHPAPFSDDGWSKFRYEDSWVPEISLIGDMM